MHEAAISSASDCCGEFDAIAALALGAEKYRWAAPQMGISSGINIEGGRHPLQELVVPSFVPNDCRLSRAFSEGDGENDRGRRIMLLSGPNQSGKSVYIKQTAIIVFLAHIGSFVPAQRATIGLTDKILTRISTRESISRVESAFAIDLMQVSRAIRYATPRSLVLVDEFGKGTNVDDGAGAMAALTNHFLALGSDSPYLLIATHFHELFDGGHFAQDNNLYFANMAVETDWAANDIEDQVAYTFKLCHGYNCTSFGTRCAALNGVPSLVVDRAEAISGLLIRNEDLGSACTRLSQKEEDQLEQAESVARLFLAIEHTESSHRFFADEQGVTSMQEMVRSLFQGER